MQYLLLAILSCGAWDHIPAPAALSGAIVGPPRFLSQYCTDCHSTPDPEGNLDLAMVVERMDFSADEEIWFEIYKQLQSRSMPPEKVRERPTEEEYTHLINEIAKQLGMVLDGPADPGRVTMRRLNRVEYRNTIRDLLGIEYDTETHFPADDVGHGFDNNGDVLSMPPLLLEKYLVAAEQIAFEAIRDPGNLDLPYQRREGEQLQIEGGGRHAEGMVFMYSRGEAWAEFEVPRKGSYELRTTAWGQQAGDEVVRIAFQIDGEKSQSINVPATRDEPGVYVVPATLDAGLHRVGVLFLNDYYRPDAENPADRDRNCAVGWIEVAGPTDEPILSPFQETLPDIREGRGIRAPLTAVMRRFLRRAWRRPVQLEEARTLVAMAERTLPRAAGFHAHLRLAVTATLVSPRFLFRVEHADTKDEEPGILDGYEIATRLSYFLWSSMPDDRLLDAARKGHLHDPAGREREIRRMLRDPRITALPENFATQWLRIRDLPGKTPDLSQFPAVDESLLEAMQQETIQFLASILREDRPVWEMLDASYTFLNEPLAAHYGVAGIDGPDMRRVDLSAERRHGILQQASILTATSNPTRTSPVKRGKWILGALLDAPPPPPLPGVDSLPVDTGDGEGLTMRQMLERHRTDPGCAICHRRMDALGLSLENYDAVGRWRDLEGSLPVDASFESTDGRTLVGPDGLRELLAGNGAFLRSLSRHMLIYALGRGLRPADEPAVEQLVENLEVEPTLSRLIIAICNLDAFLKRRGDQDDTQVDSGA